MQRVAIGFFDGLHRGHQAILAGVDRAITFATHPLALIDPAHRPPLVMSPAARLAALRRTVGELTVYDFDAAFAALDPAAFLARAGLRPGDEIRAGARWRFAHAHAGDGAWLRSHGYVFTEVPDVEYDGGRISSSRLRLTLARGEMEAAAAMLGRPFVFEGVVTRGKGRGRELGFPTVNCRRTTAADGAWEPVPLPTGVYAARVAGALAVANYGLAPTFAAAAWPEPVLELHFAAPPLALAAGTAVEVELVRFVRPERKFATLDDLRAQIAADCDMIFA